MSISEMLAAKVAELVAIGQLFELAPAIVDEMSYRRTLWVTPSVLEAVSGETHKGWIAVRHAEFGASLDAFINWEEISVAEDPFDKDRETFIARVAPVEWEFWDIRTIEPPQGIRCLGGFVDCDEFVALVWDYRENFEPGEFDELVERCRLEWSRLFGPLTPHSGESLDAYLTKYIAL